VGHIEATMPLGKRKISSNKNTAEKLGQSNHQLLESFEVDKQGSDDELDNKNTEESVDEEEDQDLVSDPDEADEELELSTDQDDDDFSNDNDNQMVGEHNLLITAANRNQNPAASKEQRRFAREIHVEDLSSDEEKPKNTIGEVPLEWYNNLEHIGYDVEGKKITRRYGKTGVDAVIASKDDPNFKWTVTDDRNGEQRVLSQRELLLIRRLQSGRFVHSQHNPYPDYVPYFSSKTEKMPISGAFDQCLFDHLK
jgi:ribosome biogenesis protein ERB1